MIAILTEKPSVGRDIARVLGVTNKKDGYLEGNGYMITWAYGHLVGLAYPEDYGINRFEINNLPIIPKEFVLTPRRSAKGVQTDSGAVKQLKVIDKVFSQCKSIIVATDAGREGELIFRFIYEYLKCKKPFQRLWISSLTDSAIKDGFNNLVDGSAFDSLYLAAKARSISDWLIGINASRALCKMTGEWNNSLGRVQTPTLAMICNRYMEHKTFISQPYFQPEIKITIGDKMYALTGTQKYENEQEANTVYKRLTQCPTTKLSKVETKEVVQNPPLLHDLTSLQKEANVKFGFSAEKTLNIAQKLYEGKLISYPRTGSRYIPEDVFLQIPSLMAGLIANPLYASVVGQLSKSKLNRQSVNDKKITDHHALLITGNIPDKLKEDEEKVYSLITGRMLEAFSKACKKDVTEYSFICDELEFGLKGSQIKQMGWRGVLNEDMDEDSHLLPLLQEGEYFNVDSYNLLQKSTKPKPLYTEASLLSAMETAGKEIEDEEKRKAMKECGIGTPATRAAIIETLFSREYILRQKKTIIPTKRGLDLYKSLRTLNIADVEMTGAWESAMAKIEKDPEFYHSFISGILVFTEQTTKEILEVLSINKADFETPYICPKCKLGKISFYSQSIKCNNSKCRFTMSRKICGKVLNEKQLTELFKNGESPVIKGFKSKKGNSFDASIFIDETGKPTFKFIPKEKANKK